MVPMEEKSLAVHSSLLSTCCEKFMANDSAMMSCWHNQTPAKSHSKAGGQLPWATSPTFPPLCNSCWPACFLDHLQLTKESTTFHNICSQLRYAHMCQIKVKFPKRALLWCSNLNKLGSWRPRIKSHLCNSLAQANASQPLWIYFC